MENIAQVFRPEPHRDQTSSEPKATKTSFVHLDGALHTRISSIHYLAPRRFTREDVAMAWSHLPSVCSTNLRDLLYQLIRSPYSLYTPTLIENDSLISTNMPLAPEQESIGKQEGVGTEVTRFRQNLVAGGFSELDEQWVKAQETFNKSQVGKIRVGGANMLGADPGRLSLKDSITSCFRLMSNALSHINAVENDADLQEAVGYMDHYTDRLQWLDNATERCAGYETEAGFVPRPEDSLAGVGDAVRDTMLPFEKAFTQAYLRYWGARRDSPSTLDPDKFRDNVTGWASIQGLMCAAESECTQISGRQICSTGPDVAHRETTGFGRFTSEPLGSKSFLSL
jgi:hypothetical protein